MGIVRWLAAANFPRHRYLHTPQPKTGPGKNPPGISRCIYPAALSFTLTLSQGVHMHITLKSQVLFCPVYQTCASRTVRFMSPTANSWGLQNSPEIIRKFPSPTPLKRGAQCAARCWQLSTFLRRRLKRGPMPPIERSEVLLLLLAAVNNYPPASEHLKASLKTTDSQKAGTLRAFDFGENRNRAH